MRAVQSAVVAAANVALPGSGVVVNCAFELSKVIFEIGQVLSGMEGKASTIKSQQENIKEDVEDFRWALDMLKRVNNQDKLTDGLQKLITKFEAEVKLYDRAVDKYSKKHILKQLVHHQQVDNASATAKKTKEKLVERLTTECSIDGSSTYRSDVLVEDRAKRYMKFVDSPEVLMAMSDPDNQKEILATISSMSRRNDVMMQNSLLAKDRVVSVVKEKLWASSSRSVRDDISNLPDWYITEDEVDIDMSMLIGFGGDAKVYKGVLKDGTPVAVKIFNENVQKSDAAKRKFFSTMRLWERLSRYDNICRLYGACYFTATPFVIMDYCDKGPLDTFLRQDDANRCKLTFDILAQAAQAVTKMHSIGIVHGDLKCDNILISGSRQAKLCDFDRSFDWVAMKDRRLVNGTAAAAGIEITDAVRYLAPECVNGMLPNTKSDVYSFGMTLYHALAGESPYAEISSDEELRTCKLNCELPNRDVRVISDGAWELITQCCDASPDERPTMEKVMATLRSLASEQPVDPAEVTLDVGNPNNALAQSGIEVLVNEAVGVQGPESTSNQVNALQPSNVLQETNTDIKPAQPSSRGGTPVKPSKPESRQMSRPCKITVAVVVAVVLVGIIIGVIAGLASSSSDTSDLSASTGSYWPSASSSSSGSSSSSSGSTSSYWSYASSGSTGSYWSYASSGSTGSSSSSSSTGSDAIISSGVEVQVSIILDSGSGLTNDGGMAASPGGFIYLSDGTRIAQMIEGDNEPTLYAGEEDNYNMVDGDLLDARFYSLSDLVLGSSGDLYICDYYKVRKITGDTVSTLYSSYSWSTLRGIALDSSGNIYVTETDAAKITMITPDGTSSIFSTDVQNPLGIAIDSWGIVYVTDGNRVLLIDHEGKMTVVAGSEESGYVDGMGTSARFNTPHALAVGSDGDLYVADTANYCIRKVSLSNYEVTTYVPSGQFNVIWAMTAVNNVLYVRDRYSAADQRVLKVSTT